MQASKSFAGVSLNSRDGPYRQKSRKIPFIKVNLGKYHTLAQNGRVAKIYLKGPGPLDPLQRSEK